MAQQALEFTKSTLNTHITFKSSHNPAAEEDWGTEYLDYIVSLKVVDSVEEAIEHINKYNTGHSESIIKARIG